MGTPLCHGRICMACIRDKGDFVSDCILYGVGNRSVNRGGFPPVGPGPNHDCVEGRRKA